MCQLADNGLCCTADHHQQRQQQQHLQQHPYAPSTSAQMQYQQLPRTQDLDAFGSPTYTHHSNYQPPFASNPQSQAQPYLQPKSSSPGQAQQSRPPHQIPGSPPAAEQDIVDRLMERYSYDEQQAWQRQQQRQQQQRQQQQQQQPSVHDRSCQQQQRGYDMSAELDHLQGAHKADHAQAGQRQMSQTQSGFHQSQPHPSHHVRQGSQESVDERSSPQLIFSHGYQQASPPYSSGQHDYSLGQQQGVQDHPPFMPKQHSLDAAESQYITQNRALLQARTQGQQGPPHASSNTPNAYALPQRHSYDGTQYQQNEQLQQQLLSRSQSLTQPMQQSALHAMSGSMPEYHQHQQHGMHQRLQNASIQQPAANEAVRHLQRHSTGQTHLDSSPRFIQLHPQAQLDMKPPTQNPLHFWGQPQSQAQPQQQAHRNPWDAAGGAEGLYSGALPKKKSSGDMSRHGSGSTDAPLSEHAPDAILVS